MKIGVIKELQGEGYQAGVLKRFNESLEELSKLGAEIVEVSCPNFEYALAAYYLIAPSECSSNLARFDAMRYGIRVGDGSAEEVMNATREVGLAKRLSGDHPRNLCIIKRLLRCLLWKRPESAHANLS